MSFDIRLSNFEREELAREAKPLDALLEGARIPVPDAPLSRPATDFLRLTLLHTGKAQSEWLGSYLLLLSAKGGSWHKVPWRMLRNRYLGYGIAGKLRCATRTHPVILEEEPVVTYVMGSEKVPVEELLIGVMDMVQHGLVELSKERGETYFFPTEALIRSTSIHRNR